jgi:hypothetical protein
MILFIFLVPQSRQAFALGLSEGTEFLLVLIHNTKTSQSVFGLFISSSSMELPL